MRKAADVLGRIGVPGSLSEWRSAQWDVIVVGAGHNGLACAAYLAKDGLRVLVLEARSRIGGACTIEEPWPGVRLSPCAYLLGLLHPRVIDELDLVRLGLRWAPAVNGLFVPFEDGSSIQLWDDPERCEAEVRRFAPGEVAGWKAMSAVKTRLRDALRPPDDRDLWLDPAPRREEIERRLQGDTEALGMLFDWSMVDYVERYLVDERLQSAYLGQGVIGTNASPFDPGTASIHFHHQSGRLGGQPGQWGYVQGGVGMVSMLLCDAARAAGAVVATEVPVERIRPGQGVELGGGDRIRARAVVVNADPATALDLLGDDADSNWRDRVQAVPREGCTAKLNVLLDALPDFRARPGTFEAHHLGQVNVPLTKSEWRAAHAAARRGLLPERLWAELYFQTSHDPSVAPPGKHTMSVFSQYVPYRFESGDWNTRREEVAERVFASIERFAKVRDGRPVPYEILGPPDIEQRVGLRGGHIFQGECLPAFMWDQRLTPATPMPGVYLCGAAIHPGGSVIGVNGRNAATVVLRDLKP